MVETLATAPPWPPMPGSAQGREGRMAWYAAVARWAPSKHNTQPWQFVIKDESLEIYPDPGRTLPVTDPHGREMVISCGAAAHHATVAALAMGFQTVVPLLPDGPEGPLTRVVEVEQRAVDAFDLDLLGAVARRRTDRGPLDASALPSQLPFELQSAAAADGCALRLVTSPGDRATLADLVQRADRLLQRRGDAQRELAPWLRTADDTERDGVPANQTRGSAASQAAEFVQRDFSTAGSTPDHDRPGTDQALVAVLCTPQDRVGDWFAAGKALGAVLLRATLAGANASYLNQPIEDVAMRAELRDQLQLDGCAQLVLRIGVGAQVPPTPRRYLRDLIHRD
ncbi:MAG: hypothetical protein QOE05_768 [Actinomycetota bacterium]|jgi:hypothetical protein|nr:hypothetical protein [Actinomycetota bacterium]